jgi:hypothetical protein
MRLIDQIHKLQNPQNLCQIAAPLYSPYLALRHNRMKNVVSANKVLDGDIGRTLGFVKLKPKLYFRRFVSALGREARDWSGRGYDLVVDAEDDFWGLSCQFACPLEVSVAEIEPAHERVQLIVALYSPQILSDVLEGITRVNGDINRLFDIEKLMWRFASIGLVLQSKVGPCKKTAAIYPARVLALSFEQLVRLHHALQDFDQVRKRGLGRHNVDEHSNSLLEALAGSK